MYNIATHNVGFGYFMGINYSDGHLNDGQSVRYSDGDLNTKQFIEIH